MAEERYELDQREAKSVRLAVDMAGLAAEKAEGLRARAQQFLAEAEQLGKQADAVLAEARSVFSEWVATHVGWSGDASVRIERDGAEPTALVRLVEADPFAALADKPRQALYMAGVDSLAKVAAMTDDDLLTIKGVGLGTVKRLRAMNGQD